jgi:hypothetical protein
MSKRTEAIKTLLHFKSEKVASLPVADHNTMDLGASKIAIFLSNSLKKIGYCGDFYDEDWMWQVVVSRKPYIITFICRSDIKEDHTYSVAIEPYTPVIRRWFRKYDNYSNVVKLMGFLEEALISELAASDLKWWDFKEWDGMQYDY